MRGFSENSISGDSGYLFRNDLKINTSYLFPNSLKNSAFFKLGESNNLSISQALKRTDFSIFYDYGHVSNKYQSTTNRGFLDGVGAKLAYNGKYFDWDVTYSHALHSPNFISDVYLQSKDRESIYFNLSFELGLF